jgi:hypothetical protein
MNEAVNEVEFETAPMPERPKTATVLGLLALVAAVMSYLGSYAMANALVAADMIKSWPRDHDPRPKWFIIGFVILVSLFTGIGAAARHVSARHLRQIEAMESENAE